MLPIRENKLGLTFPSVSRISHVCPAEDGVGSSGYVSRPFPSHVRNTCRWPKPMKNTEVEEKFTRFGGFFFFSLSVCAASVAVFYLPPFVSSEHSGNHFNMVNAKK